MISEFVSGAAGAAVGSFVTLLVAQRALRADNVTAERTKWRDRMRSLAESFARGDADAKKSWVTLAVNVSPIDKKDLELVALAKRMTFDTADGERLEELVGHLSLLLKHDWERAKIETSWLPFFASWRAKKRVAFDLPRYGSSELSKVTHSTTPAQIKQQ